MSTAAATEEVDNFLKNNNNLTLNLAGSSDPATLPGRSWRGSERLSGGWTEMRRGGVIEIRITRRHGSLQNRALTWIIKMEPGVTVEH